MSLYGPYRKRRVPRDFDRLVMIAVTAMVTGLGFVIAALIAGG